MRRGVSNLFHTSWYNTRICGRSSLPTSFSNPHPNASSSASFSCSLHSTRNASSQWPDAADSTASLPSHRCKGHALSWRCPDLADGLDVVLVARRSPQFSSTGPQQLTSKFQVLRHKNYSTSLSLNAARDPALQPQEPPPPRTSMPLEDVIRSSAGIDATTKEKQLKNRVRFGGPECIEHGCKIHASFNWPSIKHRRFCFAHKLLGMVNVGKKLCEDMGCTTNPVYGVEGNSKGRFCAKHMHPGMVDVRSRRCEEAICSKRPNFNTEGFTRGRFCSSHKHPGMVDVMSLRCEADLCKTQPCYNKVGTARGRFCRQHKQPGMVDVSTRLCEHHLCKTIPIFNDKGETTGRFCKKHKQPDMVDVLGRLCEGAGCSKYPSFGAVGTTQRRCCALHKLPGMVRVMKQKKTVDPQKA